MLCGAFPIRDVVSLSLYTRQRCNVISGDLYILEMPADVTKTRLLAALDSVQAIQGRLYIMHNPFLTAMLFFSSLHRVDGITFIDNPLLVDGRISSLENPNIPVDVEGCPRLCPARYSSKAHTDGSDDQCADVGVQYFLGVFDDASRADLNLLEGLIARVLQRNADQPVCICHCDSSCHGDAVGRISLCESDRVRAGLVACRCGDQSHRLCNSEREKSCLRRGGDQQTRQLCHK